MVIDGEPTQPHRGVYTYGTLVDCGHQFDAGRTVGTRYCTPSRYSPRLRWPSAGACSCFDTLHYFTDCCPSTSPGREMPPRCTQYTRRYAVDRHLHPVVLSFDHKKLHDGWIVPGPRWSMVGKRRRGKHFPRASNERNWRKSNESRNRRN